MLLFYAPANQQTSVWLHRVSGDLPLGNTPIGWLSIGGGIGLMVGFVFGLMFGSFRVAPLERQRIANPDRSRGISVRYAIVLALTFGTLFSVLFGVVFFSITYNYISILKGGPVQWTCPVSGKLPLHPICECAILNCRPPHPSP